MGTPSRRACCDGRKHRRLVAVRRAGDDPEGVEAVQAAGVRAVRRHPSRRDAGRHEGERRVELAMGAGSAGSRSPTTAIVAGMGGLCRIRPSGNACRRSRMPNYQILGGAWPLRGWCAARPVAMICGMPVDPDFRRPALVDRIVRGAAEPRPRAPARGDRGDARALRQRRCAARRVRAGAAAAAPGARPRLAHGGRGRDRRPAAAGRRPTSRRRRSSDPRAARCRGGCGRSPRRRAAPATPRPRGAVSPDRVDPVELGRVRGARRRQHELLDRVAPARGRAPRRASRKRATGSRARSSWRAKAQSGWRSSRRATVP